MFVRKRANKSGTYSVLLISSDRVLGKPHPVSKIIKHFGTTQNETELTVLMQQAELYKSKVQTSSPKIKIKSKSFNIASELDVKSCISYSAGFSDVYGAIFNSVFGKLDLKPTILQRLKDLVIMRIAHPASKRKTSQLSERYGVVFNSDNLYYLMDRITSEMMLSIKQTIYNYTVNLIVSRKKKIDVLFYDLTTIYFETSTQDEIRNFGFSKDGKHQHVQIMLAAIVTTDGLPIDYEEFPGNCYEGHTLIPVINKIRARYNIRKAVLVADSALMSKINLQSLDELGVKYIISARIKNTKKETKQSILDLASYSNIHTDVTDLGVVDDEIKAKIINTDIDDLLIAYHSTKRARKDLFDREKSIDKIKKYLSSTAKSKLTGCLRKSYIKVNKNCKIEIDYEKLKSEAQYDGFFGLRTNIKKINPQKLLASYRGLWQVEQTFRIAKSNLEIRPVYHFTPARIKSHFIICYMALALIRYVEFKLKQKGLHMPCDQLHLMLNKIRKIKVTDFNNESFELLENAPLELVPVYNALNINIPLRFQHLSA